LDAVVGKKVTSYSAILRLDAKIREYPVPVQVMDASDDTADAQGVGRTLQRITIVNVKDVCKHRRSISENYRAHTFQAFCSCIDDFLPLLLEMRRMIH
jgi:hypothetical protein